jgi:predicted Zn-dependent protease
VEQFQRTLVAAQGYCELSMFDDALAELDDIPKPLQEQPIVVEMRLVTLMQARRWQQALVYGLRLCELRPDANAGFIHAAFCLHELGRTAEALRWLQSGPRTLEREANYFYNLACYECVLGLRDAAQQHLNRSFVLDGKYREFAKNDPDLRGLRGA